MTDEEMKEILNEVRHKVQEAEYTLSKESIRECAYILNQLLKDTSV